MRRLRGAAAAATALLTTSTACSGSDDRPDDGPGAARSLPPTSIAPTAATADDRAAIKAVIAAYDRALVTVNREHALTPELDATATDAWAEQLITTYDDNLFSNGQEMVGRWRTEVASATVAGDTARAQACSDGTEVFVVASGGDVPRGATSRGRTRVTISLVREDLGWQIDGYASDEGLC